MKNLIIIMIAALVLSGIGIAITLSVFSDAASFKNLTLSSNTSVTAYISIKKSSNISSVTANIRGYNTSDNYCRQESFNVSTDCYAYGNGSYIDQGCDEDLIFDGDWNTGRQSCTLDIFYQKPANAINTSLWEWRYSRDDGLDLTLNQSIPRDCWERSSSNLSFRLLVLNPGCGTSSCHTINLTCDNGTSLKELYSSSVPWSMTQTIYEEAMWWNYNNTYPENITINTGNDTVTDWNYTGRLNYSLSGQNLNFSAIKSYLNTCTKDLNSNCTVPFNITAGQGGVIEITNLTITYNSIPDVNSIIFNKIPRMGENITLIINVTQIADSASNLSDINLTLRDPLGNIVLNNIKLANYSVSLYNISYILNASDKRNSFGYWNISVFGFSTNNLSGYLNETFNLTIGSLTFTPGSRSWSQSAGNVEIFNVSFQTTGNSNNSLNFSLSSPSSNFTLNTSAGFITNITPDSAVTNITFNITSNAGLTTGDYNGTLIIYRINDGVTFNFTYNVSISATNGVVNLTPESDTFSMTDSQTKIFSWTVNNTLGTYNITACESGFTASLNQYAVHTPQNFSLQPNQTQTVTSTITGLAINTYISAFRIRCTVNSGDGKSDDTALVIGTITASPTAPVTGGGGGGGAITIIINQTPEPPLTCPAGFFPKKNLTTGREECIIAPADAFTQFIQQNLSAVPTEVIIIGAVAVIGAAVYFNHDYKKKSRNPFR